MKPEPFIIERTYNAPVEKVWKAISDQEQMKQWYFDIPEFEAVIGCEFEFEGTSQDGKCYLHKSKVTEVIPNKKLQYSWRYEGEPGNSFVTFELFREGNGTRVRLTHEGLETFPVHPDFAKESFAKGWTEIMGTLLKEFVEDGTLFPGGGNRA